LNIGLLADGKAERLYDREGGTWRLPGERVTPLDAVTGSWRRSGQAETAAIATPRASPPHGRPVRRQGQHLVGFWDSRNAADGARYEATRLEAWNQSALC